MSNLSFAAISEVKLGSRLRCDNGFTCITGNTTRIVKADKHGYLYISCKGGAHYLDAQISADGKQYVGLYLVDAP